MAITLQDGSAGLFDLQGKAFYAQQTINTARGTTVPAEIDDVQIIHNNLTPTDDLEQAIANLSTAIAESKSSFSGNISNLQSYCEALLIALVKADNPQPDESLKTALEELIRQMESSSDSVDASAIAASVSAGGSNSGDGTLITSVKGGDGLTRENSYAEDIECEAASDGRTASFTCRGENRVDLLSADWPQGSGAQTSVTAVQASSSLLTNGGFETEGDFDSDDTDDNAPTGWVISVGDIGNRILMTNVEVQTVVIASDPTSGWYVLHYTTPDGDVLTTDPIPWNASGSVVQAELRKFPGLSAITVATTGTSPNFTHTITFTGAGGNQTEMTNTSSLDTGTVTNNTTVAGTAEVLYGSKALHLNSNGAELTTIQQRLTTLEAETAYAVSLWAIADAVPAAGVITIDMVDGIGGSVIADKQGTNNSFTFNASDLTTSWQHLSDLVSGEIVFRTPTVVPDVVYFRIRISTAITSGRDVYFDEVAVFKMTELYRGGPLVGVVPGGSPFKKKDKFTITVTNGREGAIQEWYNRNFDMASLGLLLPSNSAGSETIPDSVVG